MFSSIDKSKLAVGYKQVLKAINQNRHSTVYIASDCEDRLKNNLEELLENSEAQIFHIDTMKELGRLCEIDLPASCAVILK